MAKDLGVYLCGLLCASVFIAAFPVAQITLGAVYMFECPAAPGIPVYVMVCGISALLVIGLFALPKLLCPAAPRNTLWTVCIISLLLFVFIWFLYGSFQIYSVFPPNYEKNIPDPNRVNNSVYAPPTPDNKVDLPLENQSLSNLNHTRIVYNNQTVRKLIQTLFLDNISNKTNRQHLNASQAQPVMASVAYCDKTVYMFAFWTTTLVYVLVGNALVISFCLCGFMKITDLLSNYLTA
ncbi:uncharacterized protein LOC118110833 [Hippoglossus stenolepis]|uniref:uncharacterized protein LOC118110833 n=1 Tax=Hippoglossus stenolepis TaxID=195615 RepID=UPI001FAE7A61|nr:uncharacterized protein LOC118110833 [Hippoglossus stenolepis]